MNQKRKSNSFPDVLTLRSELTWDALSQSTVSYLKLKCRFVSTNTQALGAEMDVAHFDSRFVSTDRQKNLTSILLNQPIWNA